MAAYNIYEAKTNLSALVERTLKGEEVIIARAGKPVARMIAINQDESAAGVDQVYRRAGGHSGEFKGLLDELDKPWPEEVQRAFGMID
ncbi:MAG: type II toxin-antitoxin system Phd/YefM family antitoxin [Janthinobacterium lividum]